MHPAGDFDLTPAPRIDRTSALYIRGTVVETKFGASAQITVEIFHIVALFILCEKGTEIGLRFGEIFPRKIGDHLFIGGTFQLLHDLRMPGGMRFKPLVIGHIQIL